MLLIYMVYDVFGKGDPQILYVYEEYLVTEYTYYTRIRRSFIKRLQGGALTQVSC